MEVGTGAASMAGRAWQVEKAACEGGLREGGVSHGVRLRGSCEREHQYCQGLFARRHQVWPESVVQMRIPVETRGGWRS